VNDPEERPGIAGRLGQVIYWFGCALGILSVPVAVSIANAGGSFSSAGTLACLSSQ